MIRQCAVCHAVYDPKTDEWVPFTGLIPRASHGYCPPCLAEAIEQIRKHKTRKNPHATKGGHAMEFYHLKGVHVFTQKPFDAIFLVRRRKGKRAIDEILEQVDLGGLHIQEVKRVKESHMPRVIAVQTRPASIKVISRK